MVKRLIWASLGGAVAGFLICAFIVYPPRCGWDATIDLPAWVQAVGSIAAIIAAALIASKQQRQDAAIRKREADLKAQDAAMLLYEHTNDWAIRAHKWLLLTDSGSAAGHWSLIKEIAQNPETFRPPAEVMKMMGNLRVLGEASTEVMRALLMAGEMQRHEDAATSIWANYDEEPNVYPPGARYLIDRIYLYAAIVLGAAGDVRRLANVDNQGLG